MSNTRKNNTAALVKSLEWTWPLKTQTRWEALKVGLGGRSLAAQTRVRQGYSPLRSKAARDSRRERSDRLDPTLKSLGVTVVGRAADSYRDARRAVQVRGRGAAKRAVRAETVKQLEADLVQKKTR